MCSMCTPEQGDCSMHVLHDGMVTVTVTGTLQKVNQ
jgi:hypothetical protein